MLILSFDTASSNGGVGLYRNSSVLGELRSGGGSNYSVQLFEMTSRLLGEAGLTLSDVELIAVATGPGSFTGIRIGLAAAQGWARALGRPVLGVSVLEAMLSAASPPSSIAVPLLDAHRGEFYLGVFLAAAPVPSGSADLSGWKQSGDGLALDPAGIRELVRELQSKGGGVNLVARDDDQAAGGLHSRLPQDLPSIKVPAFLPGVIARLAHAAARHGRLQRPDELDAYYIRRSDAEMNWRE
jgi:tRNA threonylcarbamoyladenosine biosynthesis protein TsaB